MLAHVYQFGTFGPTAPWVYSAIAIAIAAIAAVHIYRSVRKRRARDKVRAARLRIKARPVGCLVDVCNRDVAGMCLLPIYDSCPHHGSPSQATCPEYEPQVPPSKESPDSPL